MGIDPELPPRVRAVARAWWAVTIAAYAVVSIGLVVRMAGGPATVLSGDAAYLGVLAAASLATIARAGTLRPERAVWGLIGLAGLLWSIGECYWRAAGLAWVADPPFPSLADAFYLAYYPPAYVGLVLLIRSRVRRFHASQWLDGVAAAFVLVALAAAFVLPPVLATRAGSVAAIVTNTVYPVGDLILLGLVAVLVALTGWRAGPAVGLLGAGCALLAVADTLFFVRAAAGTVSDVGVSEILWPAGIMLAGLAAWQRQQEAREGRLEGWTVLILPTAVSLACLAVIVHNLYADAGDLPVWLALIALVLCMARAGLAFRENIALADSHRQAVTDALTGLPNRRLFLDRAERALAAARRSGERVSVMIIDLDRFKEVNDTLGHQSGDEMLKEIGRRLVGTVRETDTVARLGGDEFAVLLTGVAAPSDAEHVAGALGRAIAAPIAVGGLSLDTEASIGVSFFPDDGADVAQLLRRADVAMYTAKANHLDHVVYGPEYDDYSPERLALVGELRRALGENELVLLYQPKVDLASGRISSVEVLIRWEHPTRGLLPPSEFVPLAELTTLIKPLTLHVLNRALMQVRDWNRDGRSLTVAVNVSARNLLDPAFAEAVAACLDLWDVPSSALELEITESVLMANPEKALVVLDRLSEMGIVLSIDDFGTGYSSLEYLKRLPVDVLKIDKSFVLNMATDAADAMIVRSTIDLARNLGLRVVAEGVEDQTSYDMLRTLGCHVGQGFLMSRPVAAAELEALLDAASRPRRGRATSSR